MTSRRAGTRIPVGPLRERFLRSGLRLVDVARFAELDLAHVGRILSGWVHYEYRAGARRPVERRSVSTATAERLCRAMGADPREVGL